MKVVLLVLFFSVLNLSAAEIEAILPGDDFAKVEQVYGPLADLSRLSKADMENPPKAGMVKKKNGKLAVIVRENKDLDGYHNELQIILLGNKVISKQYALRLGNMSIGEAKRAHEKISSVFVSLYGEPEMKGGIIIPDFGTKEEPVKNTSIWEIDEFYVQQKFMYDSLFGTTSLIVYEIIDCTEDMNCQLARNILVDAREAEVNGEELEDKEGLIEAFSSHAH